MSLTIESTGPVSILRWEDGENRFNPDTLAALQEAFGEIERADGPRAVVLTGAGKFFSNGLDLEWMSGAGPGEPEQVVAATQELIATLLLAPMPVLAAVNGHAFAAGAMLALACDERVMRADRGYFCLPEVDLGLPFTEGMAALISARLTPAAAHRLMVTGERVGGGEAEALQIVDAVAAEDAVVSTAVERAEQLAGKAGPTCAAIKAGLYGPVGDRLRAPAA